MTDLDAANVRAAEIAERNRVGKTTWAIAHRVHLPERPDIRTSAERVQYARMMARRVFPKGRSANVRPLRGRTL